MPGKATRPDDGRHNNKGGPIAGSGRKKGQCSARGERGEHQLRAFQNEWVLIKEFQLMLRLDIDACRKEADTLPAYEPSKKKGINRQIRSIRSYDDEREVLKKFALITRSDINACRKAIMRLRPKIPRWDEIVPKRMANEEGWEPQKP